MGKNEEKRDHFCNIGEIGKRCVCYNIKKVARHITRFYDEALRPSGLRATQFAILMATVALAPVSLTELSRATVTDRTTLTRNLNILERKGFIAITKGSSDRRQRFVEVTEKGRKALKEAIPLWENAQNRVEKRFGQGRIRKLLTELSEISKVLREL